MLMRKKAPILSTINNSLYDLPVPSNINHLWNMGSLLGFCLMIQTFTGIFLAMYYGASISSAFICLDHIMRNVNGGWFIRLLHANGASLFFLAIYVHMGRTLFYKTYSNHFPWMTGILIFIFSMLTAFLGYVLPWGQMSYWGATVITNLMSAIPFIGKFLVVWIWGSFSVDNPTLNRFFALHFLLPFIIMVLVVFHLVFIHETKSSNPLGLDSSFDKISFSPYFLFKDLVSFLLFVFVLFMMILQHPHILMDPDNFTPANPMTTPVHIQPEWYFLFAYAILRAIPNKLGGVVALLMSILILFVLITKKTLTQLNNKTPNHMIFWYFFFNFLFLTLLGMKVVESPFIESSYFCTLFYFTWFFL